ncbi:hypothetical protein LINPERHAP1_LOCUS29, partial [Linum perenne]
RRRRVSDTVALHPLLLSIVFFFSLSFSKRGTRESAPPGSEHGCGDGSGSDAVTISPSLPLRPSRRRRETQHATQKAKSDDGASKTREASSPVKDRRRADRRRFEQK